MLWFDTIYATSCINQIHIFAPESSKTPSILQQNVTIDAQCLHWRWVGLLFRSLFHRAGEGEEKGEAFIESCDEGAHLLLLGWLITMVRSFSSLKPNVPLPNFQNSMAL